MSDRDLVVANGVALDKIAKRERWGQEPEETDYLSAFDRLAAKLADKGGKVTLSVEAEIPNDAIDVTPAEST